MGNLLRRLLRWLSGRPDKVMYIGGSDTLPPPLPRQEEAEWISRLEQGELLARQTLIERNLRLVVYIARRFENTGINIEDLISIGTIGLIKAINTFRADKNIKLATYASRCIENEILMYLRKNAGQRTEVSFDEPLNTDWDGKELLLSDVLGTEGDVVMRPIEADVDRKLLSDAVARLSPREKDIISLRFGLGGRKELTQKEVADRMGISQSYISRLEKRIISRLKKEILRLSCQAIDLHQAMLEKGSSMMLSDIGTGVVFCWSALYGALLNVKVNTKSMSDREYAGAMNAEADALTEKYGKIARQVYESVMGRCS